jgi:hypothetical protein
VTVGDAQHQADVVLAWESLRERPDHRFRILPLDRAVGVEDVGEGELPRLEAEVPLGAGCRQRVAVQDARNGNDIPPHEAPQALGGEVG